LIDWLASDSGLPVLREREAGGRLRVNAAAQHALGPGAAALDLARLLRSLLGDAPDRNRIQTALESARRGGSETLTTEGGVHVMLVQDSPGRAAAILSASAIELPNAGHDSGHERELTAAISHELSNALGAVAGWARLARQGERVDEALALIERSADAAWLSARQIMAAARSMSDPEGAAEPIDLSAFVDEVSHLLAPKAMGKRVRIVPDIEPGLWVVGDRGRLWSVVWNLAANAVEALPEAGSVWLRVAARDNLNEDRKVCLEVEDNGPGLDRDAQRKSFQPFFTTKETGTGLGLPAVRRAVEELGGTLDLHSIPGSGCRFVVELERATPPCTAQQPEREHRSGVYYSEPFDIRVLVVDDDLSLREMVATALQMRGATVVAVASPALALVEPGTFDLAVVDLLLPEMRGDELLRRLRQEGRVDRAALVTGTELPKDLVDGGEPDAVVRKPFELEDLYQALHLALGSEPLERAATA